jgi:ureidoacrylate peracid hydrolase
VDDLHDLWAEFGIRHTQAVASLSAGAFGHALNETMNVCAADEIIDKHRYSAFLPNSSDPDTWLRAQGVDTLIIAGTLTNCCCDSSARDANMLGYKILLLRMRPRRSRMKSTTRRCSTSV